MDYIGESKIGNEEERKKEKKKQGKKINKKKEAKNDISNRYFLFLRLVFHPLFDGGRVFETQGNHLFRFLGSLLDLTAVKLQVATQ